MTRYQSVSLFLLRISLGWLLFYAGLVKIMDPKWSAAGYLKAAKTFSGFYTWLASPSMLPTVNFLNEWGLAIVGAALILGLGVRLAGVLGAAMMLLYYFPILQGAYPDPHSLVVDQHIVFAVGLLLLSSFGPGRFWQLEGWFKKTFPKGAKMAGIK